MGSQSDWPTMKEAPLILDSLDVPCGICIISAHRTPDRLAEFALTQRHKALRLSLQGQAVRPSAGTIAAKPICLCWACRYNPKPWMRILYSIVQMPAGIPVATFIGMAGANAALMAVQILSLQDAALKKRLLDWRRAQTDAVAERPSYQEKNEYKNHRILGSGQ